MKKHIPPSDCFDNDGKDKARHDIWRTITSDMDKCGLDISKQNIMCLPYSIGYRELYVIQRFGIIKEHIWMCDYNPAIIACAGRVLGINGHGYGCAFSDAVKRHAKKNIPLTAIHFDSMQNSYNAASAVMTAFSTGAIASDAWIAITYQQGRNEPELKNYQKGILAYGRIKLIEKQFEEAEVVFRYITGNRYNGKMKWVIYKVNYNKGDR